MEAQCSPVSVEDVELGERTHEMSVQETEEEINSNFDCWSLGVLLYTMLCGRRPFSSRSDLHTQIMAGRYRPMEGPLWENVSAAAKNLTKKLLDVDPETRWSTEQVMEHKWFIEDEAAVNAARAVMFKKGNNDKENYGEK